MGVEINIKEKISIGRRMVGDGEPTYIIAEIGINHNGDAKLASKMISAAAKTGVDAVKFQFYNTEKFLSKKSSYFSLMKKCELKAEEIRYLSSEVKDKKITFLATPFDEENVDLLGSLDIEAFKIASGDITHTPLLKYVASQEKPMIISTGAANLDEIEMALKSIREIQKKLPIALLHCISNYPADVEQLNLKTIKTMGMQFQVPIGFSDHTLGIMASIFAVASGACIIEKHFTLDKEMEGPDHKLSCDPKDLSELVQGIRSMEKTMGVGAKIPVESEETRRAMRRSITAANNIPKGIGISREMLAVKRPGTGISPESINKLIDRTARVDISEDETISWDMV